MRGIIRKEKSLKINKQRWFIYRGTFIRPQPLVLGAIILSKRLDQCSARCVCVYEEKSGGGEPSQLLSLSVGWEEKVLYMSYQKSLGVLRGWDVKSALKGFLIIREDDDDGLDLKILNAGREKRRLELFLYKVAMFWCCESFIWLIINTLRRLLDQSFTILNAKCLKWHENPIFPWHVSSAVTKVCQQSIWQRQAVNVWLCNSCLL